ncbi:MAG: hypothetical protein LBS32_04630, partial [Clostridiales Family XIII bacterium]|nr:hypothetical protein [Clostridiales Family XIII bacterium]
EEGFLGGFDSRGVRLIACSGAGGGCGLSSVAIGIGRELAAYNGRRTLYLSLESLEADALCVTGGGRDIGDFIYMLMRERRGDMGLFLESCLHKDSYGLERFYPSKGVNDLSRVSGAELRAFLDALAGSGRFDVIVLDMGGSVRDGLRGLAGLCSASVIVENGAVADAGKSRKARLLMEGCLPEGAVSVNVRNMIRRETLSAGEGDDGGDEPARPCGDGGEEDGDVEIGFDEAGFRTCGGTVDFVLSNEFGAGVKEITDRLLKGLD